MTTQLSSWVVVAKREKTLLEEILLEAA